MPSVGTVFLTSAVDPKNRFCLAYLVTLGLVHHRYTGGHIQSGLLCIGQLDTGAFTQIFTLDGRDDNLPEYHHHHYHHHHDHDQSHLR